MMTKVSDIQALLLQLVFVILSVNTWTASGENYYTELETLKSNERYALATFKKLVIPILPHDYMKEDIYLVKFLAANNFKVPKAEEQLKEMLKWREDNHVDELLTNPPESFSALQNEYPIYVDGYDKEDRPICEVPFGSWPVRKGAKAGIIKTLVLHLLVNCLEKLTVKIREQRTLGKNTTQFVTLINMDKFSLAEHSCPTCIPLALNLVAGGDKYYPNHGYGSYLINTPSSFSYLYRIVRPVLSPVTREIVSVFTSKESEWRPFLEKRVDFKEISHWYGGAKVRKSS